MKKKGVKRSERPGSNDEEVDFETLVKEEFKKLHRQYRLMEDARHAIAGASGKLSAQGHLLENLRSEKENLVTDIKNAKCVHYRMRDKQTIRTILEALERFEKYKADITSCLLNIAEMESNVDRITQRLVEQKLKVQHLYGQSMTVPESERRRRVLEDRLYNITTQFDTLVSQNRGVKLDINMMLKLRGHFYRRMLSIKRLSIKIKQRMGEVVYEATNAYDQRDEWSTKINLLRERNDKDSKQHVLEIKEFQRVLHHDSTVHQFLTSKNKDRDQLENAMQRSERKNKVKLDILNSLLKAYKRAFKSILLRAKTKDIESLVAVYQEEEQKNYGMFKFITDLNHEANSLREDIKSIKQEIENLYDEGKVRKQIQEELVAELEQQVAQETSELQTTLKEWEEKTAEVEAFGRVLADAFKSAKCSSRGVISLLGNLSGMKPHNLAVCLKILEHRVSELTFEKSKLEIRKAVEIDNAQTPKKLVLWQPGNKPLPQGGPFKPQIHVTGRLDSEQDDDDNEGKAWSERPVYFQEMKLALRSKLEANTTVSIEGLSLDNSLDIVEASKMSVLPAELDKIGESSSFVFEKLPEDFGKSLKTSSPHPDTRQELSTAVEADTEESEAEDNTNSGG